MNVPLLIALMCLVTFLPRLIPVWLAPKMNFGPRFDCFIRLIPYTAMTALIFPGILSTDAANPMVGIVGGIVAIALACIPKISSAFVVIGSVCTVMLFYVIF